MKKLILFGLIFVILLCGFVSGNNESSELGYVWYDNFTCANLGACSNWTEQAVGFVITGNKLRDNAVGGTPNIFLNNTFSGVGTMALAFDIEKTSDAGGFTYLFAWDVGQDYASGSTGVTSWFGSGVAGNDVTIRGHGDANADLDYDAVAGGHYNLCWQMNSTQVGLYVNGTSILNQTKAPNSPTGLNQFGIRNDGVNMIVDNYRVWNGTCDNEPDVVVTNLFEINASSYWDDSPILVFNATVNGTSFNTSNGTITTSFNTSSGYIFDISVWGIDWFTENVEHNVSSNLVQALKQTQANINFTFSSGDLILTPINLTSVDTGEFFNVTNGSEVLFPNAGLNNFSVRCDNEIFAPFNFTLNLTALDNSSFVYVVNETKNVITFLDENSSNPLTDANITVLFPSGISLNLTTNVSGQINFSYIQNNSLEFGDYSYYFSKIGYVNITLSDVINASNIPHTRTYNLSRAKLNIYIYDRVTHELLNTSAVEIAFIGLFNETTNTGILIKDNLTIVGGDYLIYASAGGFKTSIRSLTFTNQEEFTLNFYLLNLSEPNAGNLFVTTKDSFFRDIPGAKVDLLEYIPSSLSYVSVDSCVSNVNAECSFSIELNTKVYYIRATSIVDGTVFIAETSRNGEIFTVNNDIRDLIFFTRSTFSISTSTNLIYSPTETFINNVSSIKLDFFTSDGTAKEVCIEYFLWSGVWVSVTGDTYCLFSSNAVQNIDVDVTLNRSNIYEARIYVKESFDNILKVYSYPNLLSASDVFNVDFKSVIVMIAWIFALAFALHQKNITLFFYLGIVISWAEMLIFPFFTIVAVSVFKTIIGIIGIYIGRKKQSFD